MDKIMAPSSTFILLMFLLKTSSGEQVGNTTITTEFIREPRTLNDISVAEAFIDSNEFAVVAFFKDLEEPEVEYFKALVRNHPEWEFGISTNEDVLKHFKIESSSVSLFRQVDSVRDDLILKDYPEIDTAKLYRFLSINELRWVTPYNAVTAVGIMGSKVQVHLLLFVDKKMEKEDEVLKEFQDAAKQLKGKVLFVKVNVALRGNEKVMGYFQLKTSDLPKVAIYNTETDVKRLMTNNDFTAENLKTFCLGFLSGESNEEDSEQDDVKTEL
ncbi:endoplasmic reticulum resident protein 27 [Spea bombifrons]|uniref:endoplasmic reticulum resident protein 27 n=1 Tax=Spea bombifrons TaxID=233779 RepID=UPI00234B8730|nr:endoplasmic reticulum resident protein 27 [Spea bombifrons]